MSEESDLKKSDNANAMLEVARESYRDDQNRISSLISKSQTLATVASIVLTSMYLANFNNIVSDIFQLVALILGILSLSGCLWVLASSRYEKIKHSDIVKDEELDNPAWAFKVRIAKTYIRALENSKEKIDFKFCVFDIAVYVLIFAAFLGLFGIVCNHISHYCVCEVKQMAKENQKTDSQENVNKSQTTAESTKINTESYGTETVKRDKTVDTNPFQTEKIRNNSDKQKK